MIIQRRKFITGLASLLAAPAIVKVSALMPIRGEKLNSISMKFLTDYDIKTDGLITRIDVLYGELRIRPEWMDTSFS